MKIVYTKHADEKIKEIKNEGWVITKVKIELTIKNPKWKGVTKDGEETALSLIDGHILRIIFDKKDDIIKVITFHIGKRGRYESTL